MKTPRVIYCIEAFSNNGELIFRRYARNICTARRIANNSKHTAYIRQLQKTERMYIRSEWVEG